MQFKFKVVSHNRTHVHVHMFSVDGEQGALNGRLVFTGKEWGAFQEKMSQIDDDAVRKGGQEVVI